jgi:prevent-host-death family protein
MSAYANHAERLRAYRAAHPEYVRRDRERIEAAGWITREAREGATRMGGETRTITSSEFHRNIGAITDEVKGGGTVIVTQHGRPGLAMLPVREYEELLEARRDLARMRLSRIGLPTGTARAE